MSAPSFKQLIKDGTIKRADAMRVPLDLIREEPGFNLRIEGKELNESIEALARYIFDGGQVPPLEVRPDENGVIVVDGHRRRRALILAREWGAPIDLIDVVAFRGNDVDRTARIMTSAEGRALSPLETSFGYKRLAAFGLSSEEIARKVGKTRQHVEQLLILANANRDVHKLVIAGKVSAAVAIDAVRKHGEKAGEFLRAQLAKAEAAGKAKVTAGTVNGKPLPKKVVSALVEEVDAFVQELPKEVREHLAEAENMVSCGLQVAERERVAVPVRALLALVGTHAAVVEAREKQAARARERAAKAAQRDIEEAAA